MSSGEFDAGRPPERWLLLGDTGFEDCHDDDIPLALCADIEGLFVDLPPRPRERFTLVGCAPDGALADMLGRLPAGTLGTDRAWLGHMSIGAPPSWWSEGFGDVIVLAQRPSPTLPGTVDIDLDGFVQVYDRTDAVRRPGDITGSSGGKAL